jgi:O-antigen/teichoic acid export membrane protein
VNGNRSENLSRFPWLGSSRFARNIGWNVLGNVGGKLASPIFQVLIARLVLPGEYGVFAIALAWIAAFDVVKDWGFTHAIVVRRGIPAEIALQFTLQLGMACVFYLATLAVTPLAVEVFGQPQLRTVLPLAGLAAFISAVADPLITECLKEQRYRMLAVRQMAIPFVSGVFGLVLAYQGYGVLALVGGLLVGNAAGALSLVAGGRGNLSLMIDRSLIRALLPVGKHIVLQRMFGFLVGQADAFIVGRVLGLQALGFYRMGNLLAFLAPAAAVSQAQQVVFTELSASRSPETIKARYNQYVNIFGPTLLLYSIAAYFAAPWAIPSLLGEHWRDTVPLMQIFAAVVVTGFLTPLNVDLSKVLGFIDSYTHFAVVRSVATIVALLVAAQYSLLHVVVAWVIVGFVSNLVNDLIFHSKQEIVRLTRGKIAVTCASWIWAAFVIASALR